MQVCLFIRQWKPLVSNFFPGLSKYQNVWNTKFFSKFKSLTASQKSLSMSDGQSYKVWNFPRTPPASWTLLEQYEEALAAFAVLAQLCKSLFLTLFSCIFHTFKELSSKSHSFALFEILKYVGVWHRIQSWTKNNNWFSFKNLNFWEVSGLVVLWLQVL